METIHKIGRRKTAVARVYLSEGKGVISVNNKDFKQYFTTDTLQYKVMQPLNLTDNASTFDVNVKVLGGGITGQAEAIRLATSRALVAHDAENTTGKCTQESRIKSTGHNANQGKNQCNSCKCECNRKTSQQ